MIRRLTVLILLATATASLAQPLYKWTESDGSITFSPNQPPAGIDYETVNGVKEASSLTGSAGTEAAVPAIRATEPARISVREPTTQPNVQPGVQYAPENSNELPARISRTQEGGSSSAAGGQLPNAATSIISRPVQANGSDTQNRALSNKQRRCQDLQKRVVSLEIRLKSRLTPEDMDNTVIHMARYQRSFDQHCVQ